MSVQILIGVVGRTGAGKSSLTQALFRIFESTEGRISIDGVDIAGVGLEKLRSSLTIIPQDPLLFIGTVRSNLDPLSKYQDAALWTALACCGIKDMVTGMDGGLDAAISEGGQSLSVGQRQLLCLARAILRKSQILILDEATASIDLECDMLIQQTIRDHFAESTVITIAHRMHTVMDSSRILVLDKGEVVQFEAPGKLLR